MTAAATVAWLAEVVFDHDHGTPFVNPQFIAGLLTVIAWLILVKSSPKARPLAFAVMQPMGVALTSLECGYVVETMGGSGRAASIVATLAIVSVGAIQWISSLRVTGPQLLRTGLTVAGYVWLAFGAAKMLFYDLEYASTPLARRRSTGCWGYFIGCGPVGEQAASRHNGRDIAACFSFSHGLCSYNPRGC